MNLILMRHGEARDNVKRVLSSDNLACSFLTKKGVKQVKITVDKIARIKRIFEDYYPKTANLVTKLKKLNDGVERNIKTYETVLNEVTMAKQEIIRSLRGNQ